MILSHVVTTADKYGPLVLCRCCSRAIPIEQPRRVQSPDTLGNQATVIRTFRMLHASCQWVDA